MRSQRPDTTEGLNWKQWVFHGPIPNLPPRVDSQLRDMKNAPGVPRKPSRGDQARYWPRVLSLPEALLFRGLLEPCGSRGDTMFSLVLCPCRLWISRQVMRSACSHTVIWWKKQSQLQSLCSWCHLDLSFTSREMWGYRPGAWHSQCSLGSPSVLISCH